MIQKSVWLSPYDQFETIKRWIKKNKLQEKKLQVTPRQTWLSSCKLHVVAVEQHKNSIPYNKANYQFPLVLIFGNESYGVKEETLKLVDQIVEIPMYGINKSLNVIVAASIVSYYAVNFLTKK